MNLKRFNYETGLDIIAPLKHGTRFLEEETNPMSIEDELYLQNEIDKITNKTYWIYREPKKHMVSALRTEIRTCIEFNEGSVESIIDGYINGNGTHWSKELYKYVYRYWNNVGFNLIHLNDLSNLFPKIDYTPTKYDMGNFEKAKHTTEDIIELVGSTKMDELYKLCDEDEMWLNRILNNERGLSSYDLVVEQQKEIDRLNEDNWKIENSSKWTQKQLKDEIVSLKLLISKSIKRNLI
jgi:hypothetical protein